MLRGDLGYTLLKYHYVESFGKECKFKKAFDKMRMG